jgi:DNA-binding transcriptional regulator YdaS (Cro superfamily)
VIEVSKVTVDQVIQFFGSQSAAAKALKVTQPTISNWKTRGSVPPLQQLRIESQTQRKLKADPRIVAND